MQKEFHYLIHLDTNASSKIPDLINIVCKHHFHLKIQFEGLQIGMVFLPTTNYRLLTTFHYLHFTVHCLHPQRRRIFMRE
jgi:hypothetical protein